MRITFDTNIFVSALIDKDYKQAIDNFINRQNSFFPLSLNNEIRSIILKIHTILVKISWSHKNNPSEFKKIMNEPDLLELKKDFGNLFSFIDCIKDDKEVEKKIEIINDIATTILSEINKVKLHPPQDDEIGPCLQKMSSKRELLEKQISNSSDIKHLLLSEVYASIFADDETYFISDDFNDIINKKKFIENILNYTKVFSFKDCPINLN
ncbi:MAG: hypothetical protein V1740_01870 [Candidatus Woesearchaeota archaeon]